MREAVLACIVLIELLASCAPSQSASPDLQKELIAADRGVWEAIARSPGKTDGVSMGIASDYVDIDSGVRHSREETLRYLEGLTKFSFQYGSARSYVLSPASGYVIAEVSYSSIHNGRTATGKTLTTTVFSKEKGRWMAHLHTEMDTKP